MKIIFLICLILANNVIGQSDTTTKQPSNGQQLDNQKNQNDLEMILIITKHGEKGVEFSYPTDPYVNNKKVWSNGLDHLTNKGKEDSFILGKILKSEYGKYFKRGSEDIFGVLDESIYSNETLTTIYKSMFGKIKSVSSHADYNHKYALFGPETCTVLNRRFRRTLRSNEVKQLFNDNRELIKNITGSRRNDQKLIKNVPAVYESIQVELNNYLQQPSWLDDKAINKLNEITTKLDKLYYTNKGILELEAGQILFEFRTHFIDNKFKRPSDFMKEMKFGYTYIVGSDLFSSLLNAFKIYEQRPKFTSTIVIEYDKQENVRLKYYDTKSKKLIKKPIICGDKLVNECKLIPFMQTIDKITPISLDVSCKLPKSRTISTQNIDYEEYFKDSNKDNKKDNKHNCNDQDDDDDDDNDNNKGNRSNRRERRKQKRRERIKKYIENLLKGNTKIGKRLIEWLTELFENYEKKFNSFKKERELLKEERKLNLTNLINKMKEKSNEMKEKSNEMKLELKENLSKEIDENIEKTRTKINDKFEELEFNLQDYLENKFEEIENDLNRDKLKIILDNLETKFTDNLEEHKSEVDLELNKVKDRMHRLLNEQDNLNENEKQTKINEINQLLNKLDDKKLSNELKEDNEKYLILNNLIEELKNLDTFDIDNDDNDKQNNNQEIKSPKLSDTLINKMEETNLFTSKKNFDFNKFKSNLDNKPTKLLRASNEIDPAPAFSPKVFGITVASVVGLMVLIAIVLFVVKKINKRNEYTRV